MPRDFRGLIVNDGITFFGLITLKHMLNDHEERCLEHLNEIVLTESEATQFLKRIQELAEIKIKSLSSYKGKCPDRL